MEKCKATSWWSRFFMFLYIMLCLVFLENLHHILVSLTDFHQTKCWKLTSQILVLPDKIDENDKIETNFEKILLWHEPLKSLHYCVSFPALHYCVPSFIGRSRKKLLLRPLHQRSTSTKKWKKELAVSLPSNMSKTSADMITWRFRNLEVSKKIKHFLRVSEIRGRTFDNILLM